MIRNLKEAIFYWLVRCLVTRRLKRVREKIREGILTLGDQETLMYGLIIHRFIKREYTLSDIRRMKDEEAIVTEFSERYLAHYEKVKDLERDESLLWEGLLEKARNRYQ